MLMYDYPDVLAEHHTQESTQPRAENSDTHETSKDVESRLSRKPLNPDSSNTEIIVKKSTSQKYRQDLVRKGHGDNTGAVWQ